MLIAERVQKLSESATLAVGAKANALKASGKDVIAFGMGEPDFVTPEPIRRAAMAGLEKGLTHYAPTPGDKASREAIAAKLRTENGIACKPEHISVTAGAKHALYMTLQCLLDDKKGQEVILPTPAWVSYRPLIELAGGTCIEVPSTIESGFKITAEQLAAAITPRTVGVIINSPSNPCGVAYRPAEIEAFAAVLAKHPRVTVIADEIYEKLLYPEVEPGLAHRSLGSFAELAERTITINGMSKAFAMTGWRVGYVCAPGDNGRFAKELIKLQGQMTNGIATFIMPAIVEALTNGASDVERMRKVFASRAVLMHQRLSAIPRFRCVKPNSAFYSFPDVGQCLGLTTPGGRKIDTAQHFSEALLDEALVAVVPGEDFGACARTNVRLSFACSDENIVRGIDRIADWVARLR
ncbi:MAG: pyridoxal phosphate-dependent aminotransferase [Phycisphaerae bacterium]|nr:pyridoxal phosphate-dependent aminotransferase [Phycisphaerae bacterium]